MSILIAADLYLKYVSVAPFTYENLPYFHLSIRGGDRGQGFVAKMKN